MTAKVSFILPVLNAEHLLPRCLGSIRKQDYPEDCIEILMADGGSTDGTLALAQEYGATVLHNAARRAEPGKELAFKHASGDYLCFIDADNEIASEDWLRQAVAALDAHPDALGYESYYLKAAGDAPLNRFITGLLQVSSDPVVRTISKKATLVSQDDTGVQVLALPDDGAYPTGANGFLFRRKWVERLGSSSYHEASFFPELIRSGATTLIKIKDVGIHHYYCSQWRDYVSKRRYTMVNYLLRKEEHPVTWEGQGPNLRMLWSLVFHGSVIGPAIAGLINSVRYRDAEWLLYPAVSFCSVLGNGLGALDFYRSGSREKQTAKSVELHQRTGQKQDP